MFVTPSWKSISRLTLVVLLAGLTACARLGWIQAEEPKPGPIDPDRLFNLQIDVGRLEVLNERAMSAWATVAMKNGSQGRVYVQSGDGNHVEASDIEFYERLFESGVYREPSPVNGVDEWDGKRPSQAVINSYLWNKDIQNLYSQLGQAAKEHKMLRVLACSGGDIEVSACDLKVSLPSIETVPEREPTVDQLEGWYEAALESLMPLWMDVCAAAVERTGNDLFCSVE